MAMVLMRVGLQVFRGEVVFTGPIFINKMPILFGVSGLKAITYLNHGGKSISSSQKMKYGMSQMLLICPLFTAACVENVTSLSIFGNLIFH
jgi:hypothetical protein